MTPFFSVRRQGSKEWFLKRRRLTTTSAKTSLTRLRTSTPPVVEDEKDLVKKEDVLMVEGAPTTEPEGCLSDNSGTGFITRAPVKLYLLFDVPFQELFDKLEIQGFFVQVDPFATVSRYNIRRQSDRPGSEYDVFPKQFVADLLQHSEDILDPGAHAHPFFSSIQLSV